MTKHASYDPVTGRVLAWYDDSHPSPPVTNVIIVSDAEWNNRITSQYGWYVSGGTLVAYTSQPPETLTEQASAMLMAGIMIVSTGTQALNGTYPCDSASDQRESGILSAISAGLSLPNGVAVVVDTAGNPHVFTPNDFKNYCQAKMEFKQALMTVMGNNTGTLPTLPVTIP